MDNKGIKVEELLIRYGGMLIGVAFHYVKNTYDAEDIVQDVLVKYLEHEPRFESQEHEKAWLLRVTMNMAKNRLKKQLYSVTKEIKDETNVNESDGLDEVLQAVLNLSIKYREVIYLYYYQEYRVAEIAKLLGKREGTVKSLLARARKQLQVALKGVF